MVKKVGKEAVSFGKDVLMYGGVQGAVLNKGKQVAKKAAKKGAEKLE